MADLKEKRAIRNSEALQQLVEEGLEIERRNKKKKEMKDPQIST